MIDQELLTDAFTLYLSGSAEKLNDREIKFNDGLIEITVEFPTNKPTYAIVRVYYKNGIKFEETTYQDGIIHGYWMTWYKGGRRRSRVEYKNGMQHGCYIGWYESGFKKWERTYIDGKICGHNTNWADGGRVMSESEYENGIWIRDIIPLGGKKC